MEGTTSPSVKNYDKGSALEREMVKESEEEGNIPSKALDKGAHVRWNYEGDRSNTKTNAPRWKGLGESSIEARVRH